MTDVHDIAQAPTAPPEEPTYEVASRHPERIVWIDYVNYEGKRSWRRILPIASFWGSNKWHSEQWLLVAYDFSKKALREFTHATILRWARDVDPPLTEGEAVARGLPFASVPEAV